MFNKRCMKCAKEATHKFVRIEKNQIYDMYYCNEHAAEASPYHKGKALGVAEVLENLLKHEAPGEVEIKAGAPGLKCATCGIAFEAYKKSYVLGCPACYESFRDLLVVDLRKLHGATRHVGRRPGGGRETSAPEVRASALGLPTPEEPKAAPSATLGASALLKDPEAAVAELTRAMNQAIAAEDFEKAALCRDQIKEIKDMLEKR